MPNSKSTPPAATEKDMDSRNPLHYNNDTIASGETAVSSHPQEGTAASSNTTTNANQQPASPKPNISTRSPNRPPMSSSSTTPIVTPSVLNSTTTATATDQQTPPQNAPEAAPQQTPVNSETTTQPSSSHHHHHHHSDFVPDHTAPFDASHPISQEMQQFDSRVSQDMDRISSDHYKLEHERIFEKYKVLKKKHKLLQYEQDGNKKSSSSSKKGLFGRSSKKSKHQKAALEKWKQEYHQLEDSYNQSRKEILSLKKSMADMERAHSELELDWKRDQTRAKYFESELERLREKLKEGAPSSRLTQVIREREKYRTQVESYEKQLSQMEDERAQHKELLNKSRDEESQQVDQLQMENKSLRQQLESTHRQMDHRLDTIRAGTEKLISDINNTHGEELDILKKLVKSNKEKMKQNDELHERMIQELNEKLDSANSDNMQFLEKQKLLEKENDALKEQVQKLQQSISELSSELQHKEDDNNQLREQLKSLNDERAVLAEEIRSEVEKRFAAEKDGLKNTLSKMDAKQDTPHDDTLERLEEELRHRMDEIEHLKHQLTKKSMIEEAAVVSETVEKPTTEDKSVLKEKDALITSLQSQVHSLKETLKQTHIIQLRITSEEESSQHINDSTQVSNVINQQDTILREKQQQLEDEVKERLKQSFSSLSYSPDDSLTDQEKKIHNLQEELTLQQKVLSISRELETQKTAQIQSLEKKVSILQTEKKSAQNEAQEVQHLLKERIDNLTSDLSDQRTLVAKSQQTKLEMERKLIEMEKEYKSVTRQLDESRADGEHTISTLKGKLEKLSAELHETRKYELKLDEANAYAEKLKRQLDAKILELKDVERLEREIEHQTSVIRALEEEKQTAKNRIRRMESEIQDLHSQVQTLRNSAQEKTTHYENELLRRAQEISELQNKFEHVTEERNDETRAKKKLLDALAEVSGRNSQSPAPNKRSFESPLSTSRKNSGFVTPGTPSSPTPDNDSSSISQRVDNHVQDMKVRRLSTENRKLRDEVKNLSMKLDFAEEQQRIDELDARDSAVTRDEYLNTIEHLKEKINQQQDEYDHLMKFVTSKLDERDVEKWVYSSFDKDTSEHDWGFSRTRNASSFRSKTFGGVGHRNSEAFVFSPARFETEVASRRRTLSPSRRTSSASDGGYDEFLARKRRDAKQESEARKSFHRFHALYPLSPSSAGRS